MVLVLNTLHLLKFPFLKFNITFNKLHAPSHRHYLHDAHDSKRKTLHCTTTNAFDKVHNLRLLPVPCISSHLNLIPQLLAREVMNHVNPQDTLQDFFNNLQSRKLT